MAVKWTVVKINVEKMKQAGRQLAAGCSGELGQKVRWRFQRHRSGLLAEAGQTASNSTMPVHWVLWGGPQTRRHASDSTNQSFSAVRHRRGAPALACPSSWAHAAFPGNAKGLRGGPARCTVQPLYYCHATRREPSDTCQTPLMRQRSTQGSAGGPRPLYWPPHATIAIRPSALPFSASPWHQARTGLGSR